MSTGVWGELGRQLANPTGFAGWMVGQAMRLANRTPTALAIARLDVQPTDVVLDLGCGPGSGVARLASLAHMGLTYGVDQSELMVRAAQRRNRDDVRWGVVTVRQGRFDALPFPNGSFDRVLASNVIYFWEDVGRVLGEIRRVIRPGGTLVIYATDAQSMAGWKFASSDTPRHYDAETLRAALTRPGWTRDVAIEQVRAGPNISGLIATLTADAMRMGQVHALCAHRPEPARRLVCYSPSSAA